MGKTTLIRTLIGHVEPRRGEVKINGRVMTAAPPHLIARQGIAYVPEGRGIFPKSFGAGESYHGGPGWTERPARLDVRTRAGDLPAA